MFRKKSTPFWEESKSSAFSTICPLSFWAVLRAISVEVTFLDILVSILEDGLTFWPKML